MTTAVKTSVIKIDGLTFFLFVTGVGEFQDTTFKITNLRKKIRQRSFTSPINCESWHFKVVVIQWQEEMSKKRVMHVQSCWFSQRTYCFLFSFLCNRCRGWVDSLIRGLSKHDVHSNENGLGKKLHYLDLLILSNVGDFSYFWILEGCFQVQRKKGKFVVMCSLSL